MAPEQAARRGDPVDLRSDVFALGALAYEMLSGRPAFDGDGLAKLTFQVMFEEPPPLAGATAGLPAGVAAAVHRALEKRPEHRFPDAAAFVEALSGEPLPPLPLPPAPLRAPGAAPASLLRAPARPPRGASARWAFAAVAAALVAAATLATLTGPAAGSPGRDGTARVSSND
jgi:serine/threonine-protein kinase